jgi:dipeptidase D
MDTPTERILSHFKDISAIPRCSKNEAQLRNWLMQWQGMEFPDGASGVF